MKKEEGATLVEYSILLSFVAATIAFGIDAAASKVMQSWSTIGPAWTVSQASSPDSTRYPGTPALGQGPGHGLANGQNDGSQGQGNNGWGNSGNDGGVKAPGEKR